MGILVHFLAVLDRCNIQHPQVNSRHGIGRRPRNRVCLSMDLPGASLVELEWHINHMEGALEGIWCGEPSIPFAVHDSAHPMEKPILDPSRVDVNLTRRGPVTSPVHPAGHGFGSPRLCRWGEWMDG